MNCQKMLYNLIAIVAILFSPSVYGAQSFYLHQPHISIRAMGMGGAFTAVADDYNALFFNPAGLARLPEGQINMGFAAAGTPEILDFSNDLSNAGSSATELTSVLSKYIGKHFGSRVTVGGSWVRPGWGIGFYPVDVTIEADIRGTLGVSLEAYQDTTLQFGMAWNFLGPAVIKPKAPPKKPEEKEKKVPKEILSDPALTEGKDAKVADKVVKEDELEAKKAQAEYEQKLKEYEKNKNDFRLSLGAAVKAVYRGYGDKSLTLFDLTQSQSLFRMSELQEGLTFDLDLGALYSPKVAEGSFLGILKPTFGLTIRNVVDAGFVTNFHLLDKDSQTTSKKLGRRIDAGTRLELPDFWVFTPRFALDFRDMTVEGVSFKKSLHAGFELWWEVAWWLQGAYRMGISQGYLTAGISAQAALFRLDLATYSEEVGTTDTPKESRRFMAKMSLNF